MAVGTIEHSEDGDVDQQLQKMSDRLDYLLLRLGEQREKCTTRSEKLYLDQLRRETKKQAAAITKLQGSVAGSRVLIARSSQALDGPGCEDSAMQSADCPNTDGVNDIVFKAVAMPFQRPYRLPRQQSRSLDLGKKLMWWNRPKSATQRPASAEPETSQKPDINREKASDTTATAVDVNLLDSQTEQSPSEGVCECSSQEPAGLQSSSSSLRSSGKVTDPESKNDQDPIAPSPASARSFRERTNPAGSTEPTYITSCSSSVYSNSSIRISIEDWSDLTPIEGGFFAPPLPRKSSRRVSHVPRVPSLRSTPPVPPMPSTPPPSVPEAMEYCSTNNSDAASVASARSILSNLEKRFTLTLMTPPATPQLEAISVAVH